MPTLPPSLESPPLVGRATELGAIRGLMDGAERGRAGAILLAGDAGIGKTRLGRAALSEAERRDWGRAVGGANPVETGVPYALFADALLPGLASLDPDVRTALTRGVEDELAYLFPVLGGGATRPAGAATGEFKSRVLWHLTELIKRYTVRSPLLVVLEDLQWADASSLELLHFLVRHTTEERLVVIGTYKLPESEFNSPLRNVVQSLVAHGLAQPRELGPLTNGETEALVRAAFDDDAGITRAFCDHLHDWTAGNPFFIQETLKALVAAGALRREGDRWLGWEVDRFDLPGSIRDAILHRLAPIGRPASTVAEVAAALGTRLHLDTLAIVADQPHGALLGALGELIARGVLRERDVAGTIVYEFSHPLVRETIYAAMGPTRARHLHGRIAEALEEHYGTDAAAHADELAFHFSRAPGSVLDRKAARYLAAAGRDAYRKYANGEAATYLTAALDRLEGDAEADPREVGDLHADLARTRQRLGDYDGAMALWERVRSTATAAGDSTQVAEAERHLGLASFWTGRLTTALDHYDAGLAAAARTRDARLGARLALDRGMCLHELGQSDDAKAVVESALGRLDGTDADLVARMHRALMLLHVWTGPAELARRHGREAVRLADASPDRTLAFSAHWGMGMLEGLSANSDAVAHHIAQTTRIADEINSPVLRAWAAELEIEFAAAHGDWDAGIALGERTIAVARALNQSILLPRLLVWTALLYLPRGELARGRMYIDEAWALAGGDGPDERPRNLHILIPAHIGRAAWHLARRQYEKSIRVGEAGMAIADRHGYVVWTIHRLVPIIAEATVWLGDLERARRLGDRLRRDAERQGHRLGLAWANACDALVAWLGGDARRGTRLLRSAAEELEAVPFVFDAARVRRQLAGRLADSGDRDGALAELRRVHAVFTRLGASAELDRTRDQFRELGARPPARKAAPGAAGLTARELEIARLVMARKSNKSIGRALGISARTVGTHLSNTFRKLDISTRGELADYVREHGIDAQRSSPVRPDSAVDAG